MKTKQVLQKLQKVFPESWLYFVQSIHAFVVFNWILKIQSQPLKVTSKSMMVFSPHQDDETFGCGGMIRLKREQGVSVVVVFLTDGQGSGGSKATTKEEIIQTRRQEATAALNILGVAAEDIYFLDQPDGTLPDLAADVKQATIQEIVNLLRLYQPQEIYVPHYKDCHRDHEATYTLVCDAIAQSNLDVDVLQYTIWMLWRAPLFIMLKLRDIRPAYRLNISQVLTHKQQAIASYSSQLESLPPSFVNRFQGCHEIFFRTQS